MARWGTRTRQGQTCHVGLRTLREANERRKEWDKEFSDYAPYSITRNGVLYSRRKWA
jgi:hypothetical protein